MKENARQLPTVTELIVSLVIVISVFITGMLLGKGWIISLILSGIATSLAALYLQKENTRRLPTVTQLIVSLVSAIVAFITGMSLGIGLFESFFQSGVVATLAVLYMQKENTRQLPTVTESIVFLVYVVGVVITGIWLKIGPHISLFMGSLVAVLVGFYLRNKWEDIQKEILRVTSESLIAVLILMIIGMMIGVWMTGGTVPALIYYGLNMCTPGILLPLTFVFCSLTSLMTGTSFGTMATMGLAFVGVGMGLGVPTHIVAGAAVAGAYFGDKMSPMSDTTYIASSMSGTPLYEHIYSMMYTTVIPTLLCIGIYWGIGTQYAGGTMDDKNIVIITSELTKQFNITPWALIPAVLVLLFSALRKPAVPALTVCLIISVILTMFLQDKSFVAVMQTAFSGYKSDSGIAMVDRLLNRGGLTMMQSVIFLIMMGCMMGGALSRSGVFEVFVQGLFSIIKKPAGLVMGTMLYSYTILLMSGNQVLGIILGGRTFQSAYKEMDINSRVLSRTLEDTNTIAAPLVPWSTATIYACSVMGVTAAYIPYAFLGFIVPFFSLFCCFTGWGMWRANGTKMWGKDKNVAKTE